MITRSLLITLELFIFCSLTNQEINSTDKRYFNTDESVFFSDFSESSEYFDEDIKEDLRVRSALSDDQYLWTDGIVPYLLSKDYDYKGRDLIRRAMEEFHIRTCIKFIPRTNEKDYIHISPEGGCSSFVGRLGGEQSVSLGRRCFLLGIMMHELMHTLGFLHEQSRPDRDEYVTILWDNVKEGREDNFAKLDWYTIRDLNENYDYSSILHYSRFAFSKDPTTKPTLEPKKLAEIGQRKMLSSGDIRKINKLYNCKKYT